VTDTARTTERTERAFSARSPIARAHRRFLAKATLTMFAFIVIGAYLLPLLYMVTTSFQQPSQISTAGAPPWPATPDTGAFEGAQYPIYTVVIDGATRHLMLVEPGRESSVFVDPNQLRSQMRSMSSCVRAAATCQNAATIGSASASSARFNVAT